MILIDADILTYRCGFAAEKTKHYVDEELRENKKDAMAYLKHLEEVFGHTAEYRAEKTIEPVQNCLQMVRSSIEGILENTAHFGPAYELYLTGKGNFRDEVATIKEYKGNRKDVAKPHWYNEIREYLINVWDAKVVDGQEADDAVAIEAYKYYQEAIDAAVLVSTDKDLDMIPGFHFNWVKNETYFIGAVHAMKNFYMQVLMGDPTDNIPGIKGIGPVKAAKLLENCATEQDMYDVCWETYYEMIGEADEIYTDIQLKEVATLLWMRREPNEMWQPFKYKLGE